MATQNQPPHFLLIPLMSQSHLIPFTDMAKLLAHEGISVTIIMTPKNATRYSKIIHYAIDLNLKIQFISLKFPCQEAGLPEGCENFDSLPSPDFGPNFFDASNLLQAPLEKWVGELESQLKPNCIISDICLPWTADVAIKFKIPRVVFHTVSCFCLFCSYNLDLHRVHENVKSDLEPFLVPDMPDRVELTKAQLPDQLRSKSDLRDRLVKFKEAEFSALGVLVNSFEELEPSYLREYQKVVKNIWCIGPLFLCNSIEAPKESSIDEPVECLKWLDSRKPSSVLYVCFGSLSHLVPNQLMEIGLGLEASNCSFIWVIKKGEYSPELEKWVEERKLEGRGLIIPGWAPQVSILRHPATGGFLTHCGWNSTLEGVSSGKPMITWPMFAEQFYNDKLIVQALKIGVRVGVEVTVGWAEEEKVEALVKSDDIKKAINQLMDEGEERRKRATEFGALANKAVAEGGSSYLNVKLFIQHIMQQEICL